MRKVFWGKTAVAAMMMAGGFQGALAQATDEDGIRVVEEIIVTARKTDERLEDVPAGISVLTGDDADLLALDGVADYIRQVPNAILINAGPEYLSDISIRGQGGGRQGFSESTTGIYRNGIYIAGGGFGGRSFNRLDFSTWRQLKPIAARKARFTAAMPWAVQSMSSIISRMMICPSS
jgi:outer membrane receptor protein involved in Fe transport